jgi:tetratricopeptide (TPR) repeat protein
MRTTRTLILLASLATAGCESLNVGESAADAGTVQTDERSEALYLSVIGELVANEKHHAALAHIASFERLYGPTPRSALLSGDAWLELGQPGKAEEAYRTLLDGPLAGDGMHGLGRVALDRGDRTSAVAHFQAAVRDQPTNVRFLRELGATLSKLGRYDEAEFSLRQAFELAPGDETVRKDLLEMLIVSGREVRIPAIFGTEPPENARRLGQTSFTPAP